MSSTDGYGSTSAYTDEQVQAYLKRINLQGEIKNTLGDLNKILVCHNTSIPLGMISVFYHRPDFFNGVSSKAIVSHRYEFAFSVQPNDVFDKLVNQRREGACVEHSVLMNNVLLKLGFQSKMVKGTLYDLKSGDEMPDRPHFMTMVLLNDEEYLVDAGFGIYSPLYVVPFSGANIKRNEDSDTQHRISRIPHRKDTFDLEIKLSEGSSTKSSFWATLCNFSTKPISIAEGEETFKKDVLTDDYISINNLIISLATPTLCSKQLVNCRLKIRDEDRSVVSVIPATTEADRRRVLKEEFGVVFDSEVKEYFPRNFKSKTHIDSTQTVLRNKL